MSLRTIWYACAALMAIVSVLSSLAGTENRYPELPHIDHSTILHVMNGLSIFNDLGGVLVLVFFVPTYLYAWVRYRRRNFWRPPTPNPQPPTPNPYSTYGFLQSQSGSLCNRPALCLMQR